MRTSLQGARQHLSSAWPFLAFAGLALLVCGALQFLAARVPSDADTAYHAAVGRLIAEHGILHAFPWTPMSWLADRYADKELLFHLLFVPLHALPWTTAAKVVGTVAGAGVLVSIFVVLRLERVPFASVWSLLTLTLSSAYLYRFLLVRPHLLSIALSILTLWAATRGRLVVLAAASFLYPWSYVAWVMPLALVGVAEVAVTASGGPPRWRPLAVTACGIALGVALHPNAANLLQFTWIQIGGALVQRAWGGAIGLEMGTEFQPFSLEQWGALLLLALASCLAAAALAWRNRRGAPVPLAFALASVAFLAATMRTARFVEYFVPFATTALALALAPVTSRAPRIRLAPFALLGLGLLYQGTEEMGLLRRLQEWPNRVPSYVATVMQRGIPPGSRVFTCEWGMTGALMLALPERQFLVALDPTFFQSKDPELYALWYASTRRPPPDVARLIRDRFGARFVACFYDPQFEALNAQLGATPGVRTLLISDDWNVYDLGTGEPAGAPAR